jgi:hypothetical protein
MFSITWLNGRAFAYGAKRYWFDSSCFPQGIAERLDGLSCKGLGNT